MAEVCKSQNVLVLECTEAWDGLSEREKAYAHFMSQAAWWGARICLTQCSPEAPLIFDWLHPMWAWSGGPAGLKQAVLDANAPECLDAVDALALYSARFYGNMGNYTSFGDRKFVPAASPDEVKALLESGAFAPRLTAELLSRFAAVADAMWASDATTATLGFEGAGVTMYYGPGISQDAVTALQSWMDRHGVSPYNTRVWRSDTADDLLLLRIASVETEAVPSVAGIFPGLAELETDADGAYSVGSESGWRVALEFGDHAHWLKAVVRYMERARQYAANPTQVRMISKYIESFSRGSIEAHKESQREWVTDVGPAVETNIGFIESYRDPAGVRGEWEGFVAVVNAAGSAKFDALVSAAPTFLAQLPWGAAFEKDTFRRPDFTSLDVVSFGSSGVPAGINIPNYDEVRQNTGFKNVSLGNVLAASANTTEAVPLLADSDQAEYKALHGPAFEVQVGLHELLGHGSGKILASAGDGSLNFDRETTVSPLTGEPVTSWYGPGETYSSKFGSVSSAYEECRAEAVGLFLCVNPQVLEIFGHTGAEEQARLAYINWLAMARAGVRALEFFSPDDGAWHQAHMHARFVLLRVMLEAGDGLVTIHREPELHVSVDADKIATVGIPAIAKFLTALQTYKSTGDAAGGTAFFMAYADVVGDWLELRDAVLALKKPRPVLVQSHTFIEPGTGRVVKQDFEPSLEGMIASFLARYPAEPRPDAMPELQAGLSEEVPMVTMTIDGQEVVVPKGMAIIQACAVAGIEIPRFCYHDRLAVAGNCRMCLVEIEKARKPMASCAIQVEEGMVVMTDTDNVKAAREGVMEFLLANHPLDCPICDQGGECDLQDQSMVYGSDRSRFFENKRAVQDKDLGPLVKTVMTRCIHCTRCVRFATEVAGVEMLGVTGRGNEMEIGTYVSKMFGSEVSGNLVDICPVGALTNKPYAFSARSWELKATESIDVFDAVGSNIVVNTRGPEVMRILPRLHEGVNEEWISDKTRYACDGLKAQRLDVPMVNHKPVSWETALATAAEAISALSEAELANGALKAVAGPMADAETLMAVKDLVNSLGSENTVHEDGAALSADLRPNYVFNTTIEALEEADALLLVGAVPRVEAAIINTRIRKALRNYDLLDIGYIGAEGAQLTYDYDHLGSDLAALKALADGTSPFADAMAKAERPVVVVGKGAWAGKDAAALPGLLAQLADKYPHLKVSSESSWAGINMLHTDASRVGALDVGFVPGVGADKAPAKVVYLVGADDYDPASIPDDAFVIYQGSHGDAGASRANVILPGAAYTEKTATYVNTEGRVQRTRRAAPTPGHARPDWAIPRALSEVVGKPLPYATAEEVQARLFAVAPHMAVPDTPPFASAAISDLAFDAMRAATSNGALNTPIELVIDNFYQNDAISRASPVMARCTTSFGKHNGTEYNPGSAATKDVA
ncbi:uncharacterized protein AMSG_12225 [Thecamonas trahens ATCC 50062]|uniref:Dipeptidyl peptidase 3 n=1 Tax=Thecamonas trahens ATCC 50062 TaxID=461836 RepID=A0A0L0DKC4_THETB|nr:hypothetical protein AMSG_12225 [Thecamonas trahens ATCC 50062]KNC52859.1 hypothetical protein AMSG_12225 [Thecamonas trahens ATCC 50062]|eukprot:XP_013755011.1 hypothetical protein AMSG_12225 [Thecamonas trahens ATCC 50062]